MRVGEEGGRDEGQAKAVRLNGAGWPGEVTAVLPDPDLS